MSLSFRILGQILKKPLSLFRIRGSYDFNSIIEVFGNLIFAFSEAKEEILNLLYFFNDKQNNIGSHMEIIFIVKTEKSSICSRGPSS